MLALLFRRIVFTAALVAGVLGLSGCPEASLLPTKGLPRFIPEPFGYFADLDPILGSQWRLVAIEYSDGAAPLPVLPADAYTLMFDSRGVSGRSNCNRFEGRYQLQPDMEILLTSIGLRTTIDCGQPTISSDYLRLLELVTTYRARQDSLYLYFSESKGNAVRLGVLRFAPFQDLDTNRLELRLIGTRWELDRIVEPGNVTVAPDPSKHTLTFAGRSGTLALEGLADCKSFAAPAFAQDSVIRVGSVSEPGSACPSPSISEAYLRGIAQAGIVRLSDTSLVLVAFNNGQAYELRFRPPGGQGNVPVLLSEVYGSVYVLQAYSVDNGVTFTESPRDQKFTIAFADSSKVTGQAYCNVYGGDYLSSAPGLVLFRNVFSSRVPCPNPLIDEDYFIWLNATDRYSLGTRSLTLSSGRTRLFYTLE